MKTKRISAIVTMTLFLASGCTGTHFKTFSIDDEPPKSVSLDARQGSFAGFSESPIFLQTKRQLKADSSLT